MKTKTHSEILINATMVTPLDYAEIYEFVLNEELNIIECVRVESLAEGIVFPVENYLHHLKGVLFELNHVRVNPRVDNSVIVNRLTDALQEIGVGVTNPPHKNDLSVCFKPLGEITENVRFYFEQDGQCIFLCPKAKLKVVAAQEARHYPQ